MKDLIDIKYWIFDLDNTLYSGQTKVFSEVDKKMSSFISDKFRTAWQIELVVDAFLTCVAKGLNLI